MHRRWILGIAVVAFLLSRLAAVGIGEPLGAFAALPTTQPAQGSSIQPAQGSSIQPAQGSSIQPPQSAPSPSNIPTVSETQGALSGLVAIAKEADILVKMGAFVNPVNGDLEKVMSLMRYKVPSDLAGRMNAFDQAEADALAARAQVMPPGGGGPMPSSYVARGLNGLNEADLAALQSGKAISIPSTDYMYALDDLAIRAGRPPIDGVYSSNTAEVADLINTALAGGSSPSKSFQGGVPAQTSQLVGSSGISTAQLIGLILVLVLLILGVGVLILLRSGNQGKKASGLSVATNSPNPMSAVGGIGSGTILPSSGNDNASMGDLLEVSRRLALSKSEREAEQLIVHEAMSLVGASAGALIRNRPNGLSVAYETEENLLLPSGLRSGIIQRAAETGQSIVQVSATEPSIRSLPAALAVAPLVGNGRVGAVVVLARPPDSPFSPSELELLVSLAPVAAAALSSARHTDSLAEDSLVDPLTSLGNRRRLDKEFPELLSSSLGMDIAVMMIDIDYFKQVNDTYGHQVGDEVLRSVSQIVKQNVRPIDNLYRYGGEEFIAVLPNTSDAEASIVAQRVIDAVFQAELEVGLAEPLKKSVSIGLACVRLEADSIASEIIERADNALYSAKQAGRNRMIVAPSESLSQRIE